MDDVFGSNQKKKKKSPKTLNFIEAVREVGDSVKSQAKDLAGGTAQTALNSLVGKSPDQINREAGQNQSSPYQDRPFSFEEYLNSREKQIRQQERTLSQRLHENEKILYNRRDEETKQQIASVQEEIKRIIKETRGLAVELIEAEKSVSTQIVASGSYHLNFFARIRRLLLIARKRIAESKDWLSLFNSRQKQKHLYWNSVKKSGTKFMLSQERYMSTQTG